MVHLPSEWDLLEINIPPEEASGVAGKPVLVEVWLGPNKPVRILWRDSTGKQWRIPHNWRRRRVKLPSADVLGAQGIPREVAEAYAHKIVSVNYHPGSLCCLPDRYRFRDAEQSRWPVKINDCFLLGYGDKEEHRA